MSNTKFEAGPGAEFTMKSLRINLQNHNEDVLETADLNVDFKNTLTTIRGQCFFSSALVVSNENGHYLLGLSNHYDRLVHCYSELFDRSDFPLSLNDFETAIDKAIQLNDGKKRMHCLIICSAGSPTLYKDNTGTYSTGFGGSLSELLVVLKDYDYKPDWSYDNGVNMLTMPFQRPIASAKPTNYLGGILGQNYIDALNRFACIDAYRNGDSIKNKRTFALDFYSNLSESEQKSFRLMMNDSRHNDFESVFNPQALAHKKYANSENILKAYDWQSLSALPKADIDMFESRFYEQCFHEVLFTTTDDEPFVLEGSTFSLMGVTQQNDCVFIPTSGNTKEAKQTNEGRVLESTTVQLLQEVAKKNGVSFTVQSLTVADLFNLKAVYPVSSTRIRLADDGIRLQPLRTLNGQALPYEATETAEKLLTAVQQHIVQYSKRQQSSPL